MSRTLLQLCRAGIAALALGSCEQVGVMFVGKEIAPDVISRAGEQDSWYAFLPEQYPGFCLRTTCTVIQTLPGRNIGYWSGFDSDSPGNIIMEARGNCLVIYPDYVWDGKSIGTTGPGQARASSFTRCVFRPKASVSSKSEPSAASRGSKGSADAETA